MEDLMFFLISFVVIFGILLINYFIKKKKGNLESSKEFLLLKSKFKLTKKDIDVEKLGLIFALVNSLIISITGTFTTMLDVDYIWQIAIGFVMLMILIYLSYGAVGKILLKRRKNGKDK